MCSLSQMAKHAGASKEVSLTIRSPGLVSRRLERVSGRVIGILRHAFDGAGMRGKGQPAQVVRRRVMVMVGVVCL